MRHCLSNRGPRIQEYNWLTEGDQANNTSSVGNPYFFTGRRFDTETALYYYRARYYSPKIGRFLQADPIGYEDAVNLYIYVRSSPLKWIDPHGLCGEGTYYYEMLSRDQCLSTNMWLVNANLF